MILFAILLAGSFALAPDHPLLSLLGGVLVGFAVARWFDQQHEP